MNVTRRQKSNPRCQRNETLPQTLFNRLSVQDVCDDTSVMMRRRKPNAFLPRHLESISAGQRINFVARTVFE
jgi:hypothetical protein